MGALRRCRQDLNLRSRVRRESRFRDERYHPDSATAPYWQIGKLRIVAVGRRGVEPRVADRKSAVLASVPQRPERVTDGTRTRASGSTIQRSAIERPSP